MGMGCSREWGGSPMFQKWMNPAAGGFFPHSHFSGGMKTSLGKHSGGLLWERLLSAGSPLPNPLPFCSLIPSGASLGPGSCTAHSHPWSDAQSSTPAQELCFLGCGWDAGLGRAALPLLGLCFGCWGVWGHPGTASLWSSSGCSADRWIFFSQAGAEQDLPPWI